MHGGKRRKACTLVLLPGVKIVRGKAEEILPGDHYLYDIQLDHEGTYIVNGIISQSRSPYASVSPLEKEKYWEEENYREERVGNTLEVPRNHRNVHDA